MGAAPRIELLDSHVIDQIAAGEVIERPAAVLKELVENALDAGAQHIDVDIADGGLALISVQDDGSGMAPEDAERALNRHATSKLRQLRDLETLGTCGFRGEALSSIAAVSRFTLLTRPATAAAGFRIEVHGGRIVTAGPCGAPVGTTMVVRELFYNTPARRKFLRAPATEQAHLVDALLRVMLGARRGSAQLRQGSRRLVSLPHPAPLEERLRAAFGARLGELIAFVGDDPTLRITGALMAPQPHRTGTLGLWSFVNGRFVRERMVARALGEGLGLLPGQLPSGFVFIDVDAAAVDVNVHPQKLEVRFAAPQALFRALERIGRKLALSAQTTPDSHGPKRVLPASARCVAPPAARRRTAPIPHSVSEADMDAAAAPQLDLSLPGPPGAAARPRDNDVATVLEPLGEAPRGALACRSGEHLTLIDIALAQRALLVAGLRRSIEGGEIARKRLVVAPALVPPEALMATLDDYAIEAAERPSPWGLDLEPVGPGRWLIVAAPLALVPWAEPTAIALALMQALSASPCGLHDAWQEDRREALLAAWVAALPPPLTPWLVLGEAGVGMRRWLGALEEADVLACCARSLDPRRAWVRGVVPAARPGGSPSASVAGQAS